MKKPFMAFVVVALMVAACAALAAAASYRTFVANGSMYSKTIELIRSMSLSPPGPASGVGNEEWEEAVGWTATAFGNCFFRDMWSKNETLERTNAEITRIALSDAPGPDKIASIWVAMSAAPYPNVRLYMIREHKNLEGLIGAGAFQKLSAALMTGPGKGP